MPVLSKKSLAMTGAVSLLLMAVIAIVANFIGLENLIVPGNGSATTENIRESFSLFRMVPVLFIVICFLDILVAWAFYGLFEESHRGLSRLTAYLRIVYAAMLGAVQGRLFEASYFVQNGGSPEDVMRSLALFDNGWNGALILFGFHLLLLGWLIIKSPEFPRLLGALVVLAGTGYIMDSVGKLALSGYGLTLSLYTFAGEILLIIWLFRMGMKKK